MSVVRGRPPGLAGGIRGASRAYCSSLRACPAPKWPTSARVSAVHMTCLQQGSPPAEPPTQPACALAHPSRIGFSNGLLELPERGLVLGVLKEAAVGQRLEKGDQIGFLIVRDGEAGDQG